MKTACLFSYRIAFAASVVGGTIVMVHLFLLQLLGRGQLVPMILSRLGALSLGASVFLPLASLLALSFAFTAIDKRYEARLWLPAILSIVDLLVSALVGMRVYKLFSGWL